MTQPSEVNQELLDRLKEQGIELHSIDNYPTEPDPSFINEPEEGVGPLCAGDKRWSRDIVLVCDKKELRGYFDPRGSVTPRYFYYTNDPKNKIGDCATLENYPTHWYYPKE